MTDLQMKSISVEELLRCGKISKKTYQTLVKARMRSLSDLHKYQNSLRRLFRKETSGVSEINSLLRDIEQKNKWPQVMMSLFPISDPQLSKAESLLGQLDTIRMGLLKAAYQEQIQQWYQTYGANYTRMANVLNNIDCEDFIRYFLFEDDQKMLMVKDVGHMSLPLISRMKERLLKEIDIIRQEDENLALRLFNKTHSSLFVGDPFATDYFNRHQHTPFFYALQKMIERQMGHDEMVAFLKRYDIFGGQVVIPDRTVRKSDYTQKSYSNAVYDAFFVPGAERDVLGEQIVNLMNDPNQWEYLNQLPDTAVLTTQSEVIRRLVADEQLSLTPEFVMAVLGGLLPEKFVLIGGYLRNFGTAKNKIIRHFYLVPKKMMGNAPIAEEYFLLRDLIYETNIQKRPFDLLAYVGNRPYATNDAASDTQMAEVLRTLLQGELSLQEDEQGRVILPKRKECALADRLYFILDAHQCNPVSIEQLTEEVNTDGGRKYARATISQTLKKDVRFVNNGRRGCYALQEWQLPYFGTNTAIFRQVLEASDHPMTADEVIEVLSRYPYNQHLRKSDLSVAASMAKDQFVRLGFGVYGLKGKVYELSQPGTDQ